MKLPNHEQATVPEAKIVRYLLDLTHPVGRSKARFFLSFGFTQENWQEMAAALKAHAATHEVASTEESDDGTRYVVEGEMSTPDKRNPGVRAVWYIEKEQEIPRFITAYPLRAR